jgi:WD40 repeat protein
LFKVFKIFYINFFLTSKSTTKKLKFLLNHKKKQKKEVNTFRRRFECRLVQTISSHTKVSTLAALRDGTLASGSLHGPITIWNPDSGQRLRTLNGHTNSIRDLKTLNDGTLASASYDRTIKIWNPQNGDLLRTLNVHDLVLCLCVLGEGESNNDIVSASLDKTLKIWDTHTGRVLKTVWMDDVISFLAALKDGNLAIAIATSKIIVIKPETGEVSVYSVISSIH